MPRTLTDKGVAALKPKPAGYAHPDPELSGHYVRVHPSGAKSFVAAVYPGGKQQWITLGSSSQIGIEEARTQAREAMKRVKAGLTAIAPPPVTPKSFGEVANTWLDRVVRANGYRSEYETVRLLKTHVLPKWASTPFIAIRRSDVTWLLDAIESTNGANQADQVLKIISAIMHWFAGRDDDYVPAVTKKMRRVSIKENARDRVLTDEELRTVWRAAQRLGPYGAIVQLALLTGQRREKIVTMRWADIAADGVWTIPQARREKGNGGALALPALALDIVRSQPPQGDSPYVFPASRGPGPIRGLTHAKEALDAEVGIAPWVFHDLRRTSRSLMGRAKVLPHIAERVLGHTVKGVEGVYDRFEYLDEKGDALALLAGLIERVLDPRANVVALRR
jgi:integrase